MVTLWMASLFVFAACHDDDDDDDFLSFMKKDKEGVYPRKECRGRF